jgi:hypothetical protein
MKAHVVHWIWSLSLGGDAKNLSSLAIAQRTWANISVLTRTTEPGVRAHDLERNGISVFAGIADTEQMKNWIGSHSPTILIFHRNGKADSVETELLKVLQQAKIPCFEYNTFARVDRSTEGLWAGHAHLTCTSMMQYAKRLGVSPVSLTDHAAIGYAVDLPELIENEERLQARKELGIDAKAFVALRLVRPDLRKWDPLPVLAVKRLKQLGTPVHLVVRAAPAVRESWIGKQLGDAATLLVPSHDSRDLRLTLAASDCLLNYSHIGETFGLAMAEAMACGLPVIVNATPDMDNAQVEMCQYGSTGIIANTISVLAMKLEALYKDSNYAVQLSSAGRQFIERTFAASIVENRLRGFLLASLKVSKPDSIPLIPPADIDPVQYHLDQVWVENYYRQEKQLQQGNPVSLTEAIDKCYLDYLRFIDSAEYALGLGPAAIIRAISQRLQAGSLKRG